MKQSNIKNLSNQQKQAAWNKYRITSQKRTQPGSTGRRAKPMKSQVELPSCTKHYLQSLSDPFHVTVPVCIPDNHVVPSKKLTVKQRGSFATGSNSEGYIVFNPFHTGNTSFTHIEGVTTYTSSPIMYSDGTVPHSFIETRMTSGNGVGGTNLTQAPYSIVDFDELPDGSRLGTSGLAIQSRVVGCGLRVRFAGTRLNEGGTVLTFRREDGESTHGYTYTLLASRTNTKSSALTNKWHEVTYLPVQPEDYDYCRNGLLGSEGKPGIDSSSDIFLNNSRHNAGFYIKSAAPSQPLEFEFITHIEFLGRTIDSISKSHSDITGMSHVRNAITQAPPEVQAGPGFFQNLMTSVSNEIIESAPKLIGAGLSLLL
jgi:hypothetical protein